MHYEFFSGGGLVAEGMACVQKVAFARAENLACDYWLFRRQLLIVNKIQCVT